MAKKMATVLEVAQMAKEEGWLVVIPSNRNKLITHAELSQYHAKTSVLYLGNQCVALEDITIEPYNPGGGGGGTDDYLTIRVNNKRSTQRQIYCTSDFSQHLFTISRGPNVITNISLSPETYSWFSFGRSLMFSEKVSTGSVVSAFTVNASENKKGSTVNVDFV